MELGYVHTKSNGSLLLTLTPQFLCTDCPLQFTTFPGAALLEFSSMRSDGLAQILSCIASRFVATDDRDELAVWLTQTVKNCGEQNIYLYLFAQAYVSCCLSGSWNTALAFLRTFLPDAPILHATPDEPENPYGTLAAIVYDSMLSAQKRLREDLAQLLDASPPTIDGSILQRYYLLGDALQYHHATFLHTIRPTKPLAGDSISACFKELTTNKISLKPAYTLHCVTDFLSLDLFLLVQQTRPIRRCQSCGEWFIAAGRADAVYCTRQQQDGKTCREAGASKKLLAKQQNDPIEKAYKLAYSRMHSRVRQSGLPREQFHRWGAQARTMRQKCRDHEISLEVLTVWLDESTESI